ncbi:MAG: hypothetical protein SNG14_07590 [Rikenellaceae bacterium]
MENQLITAAKVVELAFTGCDYIPEAMVTSASIISAQRRFILPVIGEAMIEAMVGGDYEEFLEEYVEPTLAHYTRVEMTPAEDQYRKIILRQARQLGRRMSDYIEENAAEFTEYKSEDNILGKVRLYGATIQHR